MCIGWSLVLTEAKVLMADLILRGTISFTGEDPGPPREVRGGLWGFKNDLMVKIAN